jgi:methylthioribose-1-phosphate isomerase
MASSGHVPRQHKTKQSLTDDNVFLSKFKRSTKMKVLGKNHRTIWINEDDEEIISIIDQRYLPHRFIIEDVHTVSEMVHAIKDMHVRGAGLIGAAAGYGMYLATLEARHKSSFEHILASADALKATRPTAVNLEWAVNRQLNVIADAKTASEKIEGARKMADLIAQEDAEYCKRIGIHGVSIIEQISKRKKAKVVNILTHCNAGWLAFVDYGSATAPIYEAFERGINLHVWVDETRPRNQGASLTAWELMNQGIPHTVIVDNAGGHLMQHGLIDMVITGADRVTLTGDVANKIGTYLKALAAYDINIEERNPDEVKYIYGLCDNEIKKVLITPLNSPAANYGFDVTPARLITGLITERGICCANEKEITEMYAEKVKPI